MKQVRRELRECKFQVGEKALVRTYRSTKRCGEVGQVISISIASCAGDTFRLQFQDGQIEDFLDEDLDGAELMPRFRFWWKRMRGQMI